MPNFPLLSSPANPLWRLVALRSEMSPWGIHGTTTELSPRLVEPCAAMARPNRQLLMMGKRPALEALDLFSLYQAVVDEEGDFWNLVEREVLELAQKLATQELISNYSVNGLKRANSLDFNRLELRCAYMHLYATAHSHMVLFALARYRHLTGCGHLLDLMARARTSSPGTFNLTSLGGGPGSDPVGFMAFLVRAGLLHLCPPLRVTVVDAYAHWESPFQNLMTRFCGSQLFRSELMVQNLLGPLRPEVTWNLRETHFLTMLKFLSAIAGNEEGTKQTLANIFGLLPAGALVLVIDNSGGKAFKQALQSGREQGLRPVFGPQCHLDFHVNKTLEPHLDKERFGVRAQTHCTISLMILRKEEAWVNASMAPPPTHQNNLVYRTAMRYGNVNRNFSHPYSLQACPPRPMGPVVGVQWRPPVDRNVIHPGLFAGAQAFAQNVSRSFGAYAAGDRLGNFRVIDSWEAGSEQNWSQ